MNFLDKFLGDLAGWLWGWPLVILVTGAGLYFFIYSRLLPFRHFGLALSVLSGKHDKTSDTGAVSHFKALSVALAASIGMGNIAGVAVAIELGGPGIVFWMWVSAIIGMATKYFTCTLAVMFRTVDSSGQASGGPMYVIINGLGQKWKFLAWWFCFAGMAGCLPLFSANQLVQAANDLVAIPMGIENDLWVSAGLGITLAIATGIVILGGLKRVSEVTSLIVPFMVALYVALAIGVIVINFDVVPTYFALIFTDAFAPQFYKGDMVFGSALGGLLVLGVRRAAFSNEAGLGTAPMAHGDAKTNEPVHEGLVAMLGPVIDTLIVCTMTALAILISGVWQEAGNGGVTLTAMAFEQAYPGFGKGLLFLCVLAFGISSLFSYSYFGTKCAKFVFGEAGGRNYSIFYVVTVFVGSISSLGAILNFIDISFALMAVPTVVSAVLLSPHVLRETKKYFSRTQNLQQD